MRKYIVSIATVFLTLAVIVGSLIPPQDIPISTTISVSDKLMHSSAYAVVVFCWLLTKSVFFASQKNRTVLFGVFFLGVIIEILQGTLTDNRHPELLDVVANSVGVIVGYLIFTLSFEKIIHKMKK